MQQFAVGADFGLAKAALVAAAAPDEPSAIRPVVDALAAQADVDIQDSSTPSDDDLLELGVCGAPHGVRGELRLALITDSPQQRLGKPGQLWVRPRTGWTPERGRGPPQSVWLESGRPTVVKGREVWLLKLRGVETPEAAEAFSGLFLLGNAASRPALDSDDEFYVQELVGMAVALQSSGGVIGAVVDMYDGTGTHDVLRVRLDAFPVPEGEPPRTMLLPFSRAFVPIVDRAARRMVITPPAGLLEAATEERLPAKEKRGQRRPRRRPSRTPGIEGGGADVNI
ncbi:hypothetical protein WJX81_004109 [Elliptochloris bilobata]|uniref:Ribosome maturation factor RimM n=1 Tax=Elliptochloris bilobata TaxID=381761 RepID=A0AAW1RDS5_9CHLO